MRAFILFLTLLAVFAYTFPRWADWNQNSRLDLVMAIVDQGSLAIDDYYQNTGDYAYYQSHYYSDKAPGTAFLAVPFYWVYAHSVGPVLSAALLPRLAQNAALAETLNENGTGLLVNKLNAALALSFITFFVVAVPSAFTGVLLYWQLGRFSQNEVYKLGITLAFALATPAFAYSNNFLGHQLAAFVLFAAFYILFELDREPDSRAVAFKLVIVGGLVGMALITEYPTALIAAGLVGYALYQVRLNWFRRGDPRITGQLVPTLLWLGIGAWLPLVLAAAYNYAIFSTPLPVAYNYSVLWQETHRIGLISLTFPRLDALWGITLSPYRGLYFFSPFLLLAVPGYFYFWRARRFRAAFWVTLWCALSFVLFNASSAMWDGGFSVGPRYLVPALPFFVLPIIFLLEGMPRRWVTALFFATALASLLSIWLLTLSGQGFPQYDRHPLWEYSLPRLLDGDVARNFGSLLGLRGVTSLIPLVVLLATGIGALALSHPSNYQEPSRNENENPPATKPSLPERLSESHL